MTEFSFFRWTISLNLIFLKKFFGSLQSVRVKVNMKAVYFLNPFLVLLCMIHPHFLTNKNVCVHNLHRNVGSTSFWLTPTLLLQPPGSILTFNDPINLQVVTLANILFFFVYIFSFLINFSLSFSNFSYFHSLTKSTFQNIF